ncbi:hypothetical protein HYPSUDRAFT_201380 [Hypholoma sublateritium FD-334 SS-4]|uniref:Uncharacterized protein n=1 Tax=Hypholoma sublateritium (strain FD-334 SS-4) TaxID=945553 RepID=A0A0D2P3T8_HYPSF|nr:hypothetical protein HYPSUDRAFT_201380 [Hypholoma sublateritium FD-334 SS-4]
MTLRGVVGRDAVADEQRTPPLLAQIIAHVLDSGTDRGPRTFRRRATRAPSRAPAAPIERSRPFLLTPSRPASTAIGGNGVAAGAWTAMRGRQGGVAEAAGTQRTVFVDSAHRLLMERLSILRHDSGASMQSCMTPRTSPRARSCGQIAPCAAHRRAVSPCRAPRPHTGTEEERAVDEPELTPAAKSDEVSIRHVTGSKLSRALRRFPTFADAHRPTPPRLSSTFRCIPHRV